MAGLERSPKRAAEMELGRLVSGSGAVNKEQQLRMRPGFLAVWWRCTFTKGQAWGAGFGR